MPEVDERAEPDSQLTFPSNPGCEAVFGYSSILAKPFRDRRPICLQSVFFVKLLAVAGVRWNGLAIA